MLTSTEYDKVKLLHQLSCIIWFIEKHAKMDAKTAGDEKFYQILVELQRDIDKHLAELKASLC